MQTIIDLEREARAQTPSVPRLQRTTLLAYLAAIAAGALYAIFVFNPNNRGQLWAYLLLVLAEVLVLANAAAMIWTILAGDRVVEKTVVQEGRRLLLAQQWSPTVDVLIPVRGEPLGVIERTVRAARDITYPHRTIVCDDGHSSDIERMADQLGVDYFTRVGNEGYKAGNINEALAHCEGEFAVIFDSDHVPRPDFLDVALPYFVDANVGFVQSPQSYRNRHETPIAEAAHESQRVFYELVLPGKNAYNSAFSVGTNVVYRRAALADVGGLYEETQCEDIWTSLRLHQRGWTSVFVPEVLAEGLAPTDVHSFLRQQYRWASGGFEMLFHARPGRLRGLTRDQRLQYYLPALHYMQSFAMMFFVLLPPLFLLFYMQPLNVDGVGWLLRYAPFLLLANAAVYLQVGRLHGWSYAMAIASAPVHMRAFFAALFRRKRRGWSVTNVEGRTPSIIHTLPLQIGLLLLLVTAVIVGLYLPITGTFGTTISLILCVIYAIALGAVILRAMREHRRGRRGDEVIDLTSPASVTA